jgi:hypothetical protein
MFFTRWPPSFFTEINLIYCYDLFRIIRLHNAALKKWLQIQYAMKHLADKGMRHFLAFSALCLEEIFPSDLIVLPTSLTCILVFFSSIVTRSPAKEEINHENYPIILDASGLASALT